MSIAQPLTALKAELLQNLIPHVVDFLATALADGTPAHDVERGLWDFALQLGRQALTAFFDAHGTGDLGATLTLPDGQEVRRLEELHTRRYVSVFGEFTLARAAYGSREGQA